MKTIQKKIGIMHLGWLIPVGILLLGIVPVTGAGEHMLNLGGRYHAEHHHFDKLPFGNGDISYLIGYSYSESITEWQLALDYAPDVSGTMIESDENKVTDFDYVLTPQFNLVFKDRYFRGGAGIRTSYIQSDDGSEWLDPYWQLMLGLNFPVFGRFSLDAAVLYVLEKWGKIDQFDFRDLEYALTLNCEF